jgi:hypothetical protein
MLFWNLDSLTPSGISTPMLPIVIVGGRIEWVHANGTWDGGLITFVFHLL